MIVKSHIIDVMPPWVVAAPPSVMTLQTRVRRAVQLAWYASRAVRDTFERIARNAR